MRSFTIGLILAGTLLRVLFLTETPLGLNQDEASTGYEAWSLLNYGIDRNGDSLPVLLTSWGSGQNALYSYLAMPFVAIFGLNVFSLRLPAAILGALGLVVAYLIGKRVKDERFGLILTLVLAFNPWHFTATRWALESNILPFFILLSIYGAISWDSNSKGAHILTAAALGLSLYAYGTAFIWAPIFAVTIAVRRLIRSEGKIKTLKQVAVAFVVFAIIAFPIVLCNLRNMLGLPEMKLLWFTLPQLTETRQTATMSFDVIANLKKLVLLLWTQSDGLPWNSVPGFGLLYGKLGLLFVILGMVGAVILKRGAIAFIALGAAIVTSMFVDVNINRVNVLMIPFIYFQAVGIYFIAAKVKYAYISMLPTLAILGALFSYTYFTSYSEQIAPYFLDRSNMPYIYVLFEERVSPYDFVNSVEYMNPGGAFQWPVYFNWHDESGEFHEWRLEQYE